MGTYDVLEIGSCFLFDMRCIVITLREMGENELLDIRLGSDKRSLLCGQMLVLLRAILMLRAVGAFDDHNLSIHCKLRSHRRDTRVGDDRKAPSFDKVRRLLDIDLDALIRDWLSIGKLLQMRTFRDPELVQICRVDAAPVLFDEDITDAGDAMVHRRALDQIPVRFTDRRDTLWVEFFDVKLDLEVEDRRLQQMLHTQLCLLWPKNVDGLALVIFLVADGLQKPNDTADVVSMPVANEDAADLISVDPGDVHLPLRALSAVKEHALSMVFEVQSAHIAVLCRHHAGRAKDGCFHIRKEEKRGI